MKTKLLTGIMQHLGAALLGLALGASAMFLRQPAATTPSVSGGAEKPMPAAKFRSGAEISSALRAEFLERYAAWLRTRSWREKLAMEETIVAFLQLAPTECCELLRSRHLLGVATDNSLVQIGALGAVDYADALRAASTIGGRVGDLIIKSAFEREYEKDPGAAFFLIGSLPAHLRGNLTLQLGEKWFERDGAAAAQVFTVNRRNLDFPDWNYLFFNNLLDQWAKTDPDGAARFLTTSEAFRYSPESSRLRMIESRGEHEDLVMPEIQSIIDDRRVNDATLGKLFQMAAIVDGAKALQLVEGLNEPRRTKALAAIAEQTNDADHPDTAFQAAAEMPVSQQSLELLKDAVNKLTAQQDDPFAMLDLATDAYQRSAVAAGVTQALQEREGVAGIESVMQQGIATKSNEWIEAAANSVIAKDESETETTPGKWKALSAKAKAALVRYAAANWTPEKAALLRQDLK